MTSLRHKRSGVAWWAFVFCFSSFASSCANNQAKAPYENELGIKPATLAQIDSAHYTTIQWLVPEQNFGIIKYGDSVRLSFRFRNTGVHPLFLSAVATSCGCTATQYPSGATMPGDEDSLNVVFNSIGQAEEIHKTITVTSNTSNGIKHLLVFRGQVKMEKTDKKTK